jgi:chitodextrinase
MTDKRSPRETSRFAGALLCAAALVGFCPMGAWAATRSHVATGLDPSKTYNVYQNGGRIHSGLSPTSSGGVLAFTSEDGGVFRIVDAATDQQSDTTPPAAVTTLATGAVTSGSVTISWTAPGDDGTSGVAASYDVRYSTSAITSANFASASAASNEPAPASPGTTQSMTITGLAPGTTYYFAMKTADEVPNWSAISNVATTTTSPPPDTTPPAAVTTLATGAVTSGSVAISWTAPGDDGTSGVAASYDVRYSTAAITSANFTSALAAGPEPVPAAPGTTQSMTISGLAAGTTYYFAMKTADEVPNWSAISNVPTATTTPLPDTTPPAAVTTLATGAVTSGSVAISWTAPGDDGTSGVAATYDVRYSAAPITSANFGTAPAASNEPAPASPGTTQSMTISGLAAATTYYFAMKTADEVSNWSAISNVPAATTTPLPDTTPPAAVTTLAPGAVTSGSVTISWTAPGDDGTSGVAASYDVRYSAAAITSANFETATAVIGEPPPASPGATQSMTVSGLASGTTYYFAMKTADEVPNWSAISNVPATTTSPPPDTTPPAAVTTLATGTVTTSAITITWIAPGDDGASGVAASYDVRYSTSTITSANFASASAAIGEPAPASPGTTQSMTVTGLGAGSRYYFAIKTADEVPNWSAISNVPSAVTATPPPDTTPPAAVTNLVAGSPSASTIVLSWTAPGDDGTAGAATAYDIRRSASPITEASFMSATMLLAAPVPATAGTVQTCTATGLSAGTTYYFALRARDEASNWSAVSNSDSATTLPPPDTTPPARITGLTATAISHSEMRIAWNAPGDDGNTGQAAGYDLRRHSKSITSSNWSQATPIEGLPVPATPGTREEVTVGGLNANTRYYFAVKARDEVPNWSTLSSNASGTTLQAPPPPDTTPPAPIADLAIVAGSVTHTSATLRWTAPGDDGTAGRSDHYEIRHAHVPVTAANWDGCAPWTSGVPSPADAGTQQQLALTGLVPETTYWFAVRAADEAGNLGAAANGATFTTAAPPDTTPPSRVTDLAAGAVGTDGTVRLTWSAPADDGAAARAASYDLRRLEGGLTDETWGSAAEIPGAPVPSAASEAETLLVPGLAAGTVQAFALKAADGSGNISLLSNVATVTVPFPPDTTPPEPVTDLRGVSVTATSATIAWSAPSSAGAPAVIYEMRRAAGDAAVEDWDEWSPVDSLPVPAAPGAGETKTVHGLSPATRYGFALRSSDGLNWSLLSNVAVVETAPPPDTTPPAPVADLEVTATTPTAVTLRWTAPGDDGMSGRAQAYELRRSAEPISESSWESAFPVPGIAAPSASGEPDSFTIGGLTPETVYHFSLRATDDAGLRSGLSNDAVATTASLPDTISPATVSDLEARSGSMKLWGVTVTWTAPGDDGVVGQASSYDLRRSEVPLTEAVWQTASAVPSLPAPSSAGAQDSVRIAPLEAGRTYHVRLCAADESGCTSGLSNELVIETPAPPAVADLAATSGAGQITFSWTWPAVEPFCGLPESIEARVAEAPIDAGGWDSASPVTLSGADFEPGAGASWTVSGLLAGASRSLALRLVYSGGATSAIASATAPSGEPPDVSGPSAVADLRVIESWATCVRLTWSAPGDEVTERTSAYDIRYSTSEITSASFAQATAVTGQPVPREPGAAESLDVCGLQSGTRYYFAIKSSDGSGNWADMSNVATATTTLPPDASPPSTPTGVTAACDAGRITLTWQPNAEPDLAGYAVFVTPVNPEGPTVEHHVAEETFIDSPRPGGVTVSYAVSAVDAADNASAPSTAQVVEVCDSEQVPTELRLLNPWPNPFCGMVTIPVDVPSALSGRTLRLYIYDTSGRRVRTLELPSVRAGRSEFTWDALNASGGLVAPGLYIGRVEPGRSRVTMARWE